MNIGCTGSQDEKLFRIDSATRIETYWVLQYVNQAVSKLGGFFGRTR